MWNFWHFSLNYNHCFVSSSAFSVSKSTDLYSLSAIFLYLPRQNCTEVTHAGLALRVVMYAELREKREEMLH